MKEEITVTQNRLIRSKDDIPIEPKHINTAERFWDCFGNTETEASAHWIVRLFQERGDWGPFTHEEIQQFYKNHVRNEQFCFNWLMGPYMVYGILEGNVAMPAKNWIVESDGQLFVTLDFVYRCYKSSPVLPK